MSRSETHRLRYRPTEGVALRPFFAEGAAPGASPAPQAAPSASASCERWREICARWTSARESAQPQKAQNDALRG